MNRFFRFHPLVIIASCLIILSTTLSWFDRQIAQPRFDAAQLAHYKPGDSIPFIVCWVETAEEKEGMIRIRDFRGSVSRAVGLSGKLRPGSVLILKGVMGKHRNVQVEAVDYDPLFPLKAWGSFAAFLFILWNLVRSVRWTPQGLKLNIPGQVPSEKPCPT